MTQANGQTRDLVKEVLMANARLDAAKADLLAALDELVVQVQRVTAERDALRAELEKRKCEPVLAPPGAKDSTPATRAGNA